MFYQVDLAFARHYSIKLPEWMTWGYDGWAGVGVLKNDKVKLVVDVSIPLRLYGLKGDQISYYITVHPEGPHL